MSIMQTTIENKIFDKVMHMNTNQKEEVLSYLHRMPAERHSTRRYKSKAMRQIREALQKEF